MPSERLILVAEDDPSLRYLAKRQLLSLGYECEFANDGTEAVRMSMEKKYDVILMDVQMPVMDGLEATELIRKNETSLGISTYTPIIAITANPDKEKCFAAGMNDFLFKPVEIGRLKIVIERWMPVYIDEI